MKLSIVILLISISFTQLDVNYKTSYVWKANMLLVTYIKPNLIPNYKDCYSLINMKEYVALSKMEKLLEEVKKDRHPEWRARQIVNVVNDYVSYKKKFQENLNKMSKEIERIRRFNN